MRRRFKVSESMHRRTELLRYGQDSQRFSYLSFAVIYSKVSRERNIASLQSRTELLEGLLKIAERSQQQEAYSNNNYIKNLAALLSKKFLLQKMCCGWGKLWIRVFFCCVCYKPTNCESIAPPHTFLHF